MARRKVKSGWMAGARRVQLGPAQLRGRVWALPGVVSPGPVSPGAESCRSEGASEPHVERALVPWGRRALYGQIMFSRVVRNLDIHVDLTFFLQFGDDSHFFKVPCRPDKARLLAACLPPRREVGSTTAPSSGVGGSVLWGAKFGW